MEQENKIIRLRNDSEANFIARNTLLLAGETAHVTGGNSNLGRHKIGPGRFNELDYADEWLAARLEAVTPEGLENLPALLAALKKSATLVVGNSAAGHTAAGVDFLCTGANDHAVINAAIAALPAGGGKIVIREGTYNLGGPINVDKDNVTIEGMGPSTILEMPAPNVPAPAGAAAVKAAASGCKIAGLKIAGSLGGTPSYGAYVSGNNNEVSGCIIANSGNSSSYGVYVSGNNNLVSGCIIANAAVGGSPDAYGVYISGSGNTVSGNSLSNSGGGGSFGVYISGDGSGNLVSGNSLSNSGNMICYGVYISGNGNGVSGNDLSNANAASGGSYGVYVAGSDNLVSGCIIANSGNSSSYGVYVGGNNNLVSGNSLSNSGGDSYGVYVSGNNNLVSGCIIANATSSYSGGSYGVCISGGGNSAAGNTICNCSSSYNGKSYGVYVGGGNNDASRNTVANKRSSGQTDQNTAAFYLTATATHCRIHGNDVSGVTGASGAVWFNGAAYSTAVPAGSPTGAAAWQSGSCGFNIVSRPA